MTITKKMLKQWIGKHHLNEENLLRLIVELLNKTYTVDDCREDLLAYLDLLEEEKQ
jgi:hypothetical protein